MSNFKDTSWVPQQHQQLQAVLSTLNYCMTCTNVPVVDPLLIICNQELMWWKDVSHGYEEHQWRRLSKALTADGDENEQKKRFGSLESKFFFCTLLFSLIKMCIGLMDTPIPPPPYNLLPTTQESDPLSKRSIDYWVRYPWEEFLKLVSPLGSIDLPPDIFHFQENATIPPHDSPLSSRLLDQANAFSSVVNQGWLVANTLFVAWAVHSMMERGSSFVVSTIFIINFYITNSSV